MFSLLARVYKWVRTNRKVITSVLTNKPIGKKRGLVDSDYRALGNGSGRAVR